MVGGGGEVNNTEIMIVVGVIICVLIGWLIGLYSEIHDLKQEREKFNRYIEYRVREIGALKYQLNQHKTEKTCKHYKKCTFFEVGRDTDGQSKT